MTSSLTPLLVLPMWLVLEICRKLELVVHGSFHTNWPCHSQIPRKQELDLSLVVFENKDKAIEERAFQRGKWWKWHAGNKLI